MAIFSNDKMSKSIKIGVLAGMGPRSTGPFLEQLLDQCQKQYGAEFDISFPHIIIYSLPTPFYPSRPIEKDKMLEALKEGIDTLNSANVDFIAVPCITVHQYFEYMQSVSSCRILNLIDEITNKECLNSGISAILATNQTMKSNLFQNKMTQNQCQYFDFIHWQEKVDLIIQKVKKESVNEDILTIWNYLYQELQEYKINNLIIGCTDICFIKKHCHNINIIDASETLAETTIQYYLNCCESEAKQ